MNLNLFKVMNWINIYKKIYFKSLKIILLLTILFFSLQVSPNVLAKDIAGSPDNETNRDVYLLIDVSNDNSIHFGKLALESAKKHLNSTDRLGYGLFSHQEAKPGIDIFTGLSEKKEFMKPGWGVVAPTGRPQYTDLAYGLVKAYLKFDVKERNRVLIVISDGIIDMDNRNDRKKTETDKAIKEYEGLIKIISNVKIYTLIVEPPSDFYPSLRTLHGKKLLEDLAKDKHGECFDLKRNIEFESDNDLISSYIETIINKESGQDIDFIIESFSFKITEGEDKKISFNVDNEETAKLLTSIEINIISDNEMKDIIITLPDNEVIRHTNNPTNHAKISLPNDKIKEILEGEYIIRFAGSGDYIISGSLIPITEGEKINIEAVTRDKSTEIKSPLVNQMFRFKSYKWKIEIEPNKNNIVAVKEEINVIKNGGHFCVFEHNENEKCELFKQDDNLFFSSKPGKHKISSNVENTDELEIMILPAPLKVKEEIFEEQVPLNKLYTISLGSLLEFQADIKITFDSDSLFWGKEAENEIARFEIDSTNNFLNIIRTGVGSVELYFEQEYDSSRLKFIVFILEESKWYFWGQYILIIVFIISIVSLFIAYWIIDNQGRKGKKCNR